MSVTISGGSGGGLVPQNMSDAIKLAEMMTRGKLVPAHLQNSPGDCLMVIEQASRWGMSPFAVAQSTSVIQGKLMFEGKLVAAALHSSGVLSTRLDYAYSGSGESRSVRVSATLVGEATPRAVDVAFKDARTTNRMWTSQPDQQLAYHGARVWARRYAPEVMLGVYSPEEMTPVAEVHPGPTIDVTPAAPALATSSPRHFKSVAELTAYCSEQGTTRTTGQWLDAVEVEFEAATTAEEVDAIHTRGDVQMAIDKLRNGQLTRLNAMLNKALDRTEPAPSDVAPEASDAAAISEDAIWIIKNVEESPDIHALTRLIQQAAVQSKIGAMDAASRSAVSTAVSAAKMGFTRNAA